MTVLSDMIRQRRLELKLSQNKLGEMVGYTQQAIQFIEKGTRGVDDDKIPLFAKALNVSIDYLYGFTRAIKTVHKIGFVEAGKWTEAVQLPESEWEEVNYAINDNLRDKDIFALGVRGNSMNKIFMPEKTTLICLSVSDYYEVVPGGVHNGDFVIAQRVDAAGKYESTVKRYNKLEDGTVILEAMSTDPRYSNIVVGTDDCEYKIIAVVIDYQIKLKEI